MKSYTNRHMGDSLKELMIRIQIERKVEEHLHIEGEKDTQLSDLFCESHV
jgi:hypothetical protein